MTTSRTFAQSLQDYKDTLAAVQREEKERLAVKNLPEYVALEEKIVALQQEQNRLLATVPDHREEHDMDRAELFEIMKAQAIYEVPGWIVKTRTTKEVNTTKVLHALEGDLDQFFLLANVTQKALTEYGKLHPELSKSFKGCVEIDTVAVTDLIPEAGILPSTVS